MDNSSASVTESPGTAASYRSRLVDVIFSYLAFVVIGVGILGNLLSIVVFIRRRNSDRISAIYLTVLAVADCSMLLTISWPMTTTKARYLTNDRIVFQNQLPNEYFCKIIIFSWNLCALMSSWTIILFSFERMLVMWWPLKMAPYCSAQKPRKLALLVLFLVMVLICSGLFRWITLRPASLKFQRCTGRIDLEIWEQGLYAFIQYGLANGMPIFIISFLNVMILLGIKRNRLPDDQKSKKSNKTDRKCLINLLIVCLFYLIFITPVVISYSLYYYWESVDFPGFTARTKSIFLQFWECAQAFTYCNYATNCFIYVYSLPFYRQEVKRMFCGRSVVDDSKTRQTQLTGSTTNTN